MLEAICRWNLYTCVWCLNISCISQPGLRKKNDLVHATAKLEMTFKGFLRENSFPSQPDFTHHSVVSVLRLLLYIGLHYWHSLEINTALKFFSSSSFAIMTFCIHAHSWSLFLSYLSLPLFSLLKVLCILEVNTRYWYFYSIISLCIIHIL